MGPYDSDHKPNIDNFYSPICASGYLTPLQRKKLREKRNTPLSANFESDYKTPKSAKDSKKPKRPSTTSKPKKTPKEQKSAKPLKENSPELRCSIASLVAHNPNQEKRFFKNRSPQHLTKTEFVLPLKSKKRCLDFSGLKNGPLRQIQPTEQNMKNKSLDNSLETSPLVDEITSNSSVVGTPKKRLCNGEPVSVNKSHDKPVLVNKSHDKPVSVNKSHDKPVSGNKSPDKPVSVNKSHEKPVSVNKSDSDDKHVPVDESSVSEIVDSTKSDTCISGGLFDFNWPSDAELMKRQNKARADAKKTILANRDLLNSSSSSEGSLNVSIEKLDAPQNSSPKLFPIFSNMKIKNTKQDCKTKGPKKTNCIRDTSRGDEQMIIDAGQKEIGSRLCKTCNMLYTIGHEEDERLHAAYHHSFLVNLRFTGWKEECIVGEFDDGRIIKVLDTDKNFKLKKVQDVLTIANRDLGFSTSGFPTKPNILFYLFISNDKRIGGMLVAEHIESACPVVLGNETPTVKDAEETPIWKLGSWYASTKPVKAICGINRIWVAMEFRRQKVASRLVDCLRGSFIYGHVVDFREMAFTDPSLDGREFAASYTGTDNFLVYK